MRFMEKRKENRLNVSVLFSAKEQINHAELSYFAAKNLRYFLHPAQEGKNRILYSGKDVMTLFSFLDQPMTQYAFFSLIEQFVDASICLQEEMFPLSRVLWEIGHVYIDEITKEARLIYLPTERKTEHTEILAFFVHIMNALKPALGTDTDYLVRFYQFLETQRDYDPAAIESYIEKVDRNIVATVKQRQPGEIMLSVDKCRVRMIRRGDEILIRDVGLKSPAFLNGCEIPEGVVVPVPDRSEIRIDKERFLLTGGSR